MRRQKSTTSRRLATWLCDNAFTGAFSLAWGRIALLIFSSLSSLWPFASTPVRKTILEHDQAEKGSCHLVYAEQLCASEKQQLFLNIFQCQKACMSVSFEICITPGTVPAVVPEMMVHKNISKFKGRKLFFPLLMSICIKYNVQAGSAHTSISAFASVRVSVVLIA